MQKLSEEQIEDIYKMWLDGYDFIEIAKKMGISRQLVRYHVKEPSMKDYKKHDDNARKRKFNKELDDSYKEYENGEYITHEELNNTK